MAEYGCVNEMIYAFCIFLYSVGETETISLKFLLKLLREEYPHSVAHFTTEVSVVDKSSHALLILK